MTRKDGNQGYFSVALASSDSREVGHGCLDLVACKEVAMSLRQGRLGTPVYTTETRYYRVHEIDVTGL